MIIKLSNKKYFIISGCQNSVSYQYLKENLIYLLPLFTDIINYYQKNTFIPDDFYHFANAKPNKLLLTLNEYYAYQVYNLLLLPETENKAVNDGWIKQSEMDSRFHNIGKRGYVNKKYLKLDKYGGFLEAVYDELGNLVLDHKNDGTYNLYANNPLHFIDIILWLMYGVLSYDKLTVNDRVTVLKSSLEEVYHYKHL